MSINKLVSLNIRHLAKQKGIRIGDLEKQLGVRVGYFSRKYLNDSEIVSLEIIYNAAKILETTIDDLCSDRALKEIEAIANEFGYELVPKGRSDES